MILSLHPYAGYLMLSQMTLKGGTAWVFSGIVIKQLGWKEQPGDGLRDALDPRLRGLL
jgi:hypothetical protein